MRRILAIASITLREGLRHRILYGVLIFAILLLFFAVLTSGLFMRDTLKVLLDICLSATSLSGLLVPFFLGITLLARDIETKTIYTILAKPISRSEYIMGKFVGLSFITAIVMTILTFTTFLGIWLATYLYADYFFSYLKFSSIFLAILTSYLSILVLNGAVVLWCSITTSSLLATLLTLSTYVIGQSVEDLVRFFEAKVAGVVISPLVEYTVKTTMYVFPNLAAFDLKEKAAYGLPIPWSQIFFLSTYALVYTSILLILATFAMSRRDLP